MRTIEQFHEEINEWKEMYEREFAKNASLETQLVSALETISKYQKFFVNNEQYCNWMRDFNEDFKQFKQSPYYKRRLSTSDNSEDTEYHSEEIVDT